MINVHEEFKPGNATILSPRDDGRYDNNANKQQQQQHKM